MNSSSYKTIEQIINEAGKRDFDTMVSVPVTDLRDLFKSVKHALRAQGILGFNDDGHQIVNDIGMVPIVRSVAEEDFGSYGPIKSCEISRPSQDREWHVKMVFSHPSGDITINRSYSLPYLETRRRFEFKLS